VSSFGPTTLDAANRDDWLFDASLAILGVTLVLAPYLVVLGYYAPNTSTSELVVATVVGLALCLSALLRRHLPIIFTLLVALLTAIHVIVVPLPFSMLVVVPASVHAVARYVRRSTWWVLILWGLGGVACVVRWYMAYEPTDALRTVSILGGVSFVGLVAAAYSVGRRGFDLAQARALEAEQVVYQEPDISALVDEQHAADVEVRAALANEVHDGVAHALSLVIVQAEEAKTLVSTRPTQATQVMDVVVDTCQDALTELRRVVRVLRAEQAEEAIAHLPTPLWDDVPRLVSEAGATLSVNSEPPESIDDVLGLTVYRIIQEALTNVLQHAGPNADPEVLVDWGDEDVEVSITNQPTDFVSPATGGGQGLDTMAERVEAVAGLLETGPTEDGGFRVWASLPYDIDDLIEDEEGYDEEYEGEYEEEYEGEYEEEYEGEYEEYEEYEAAEDETAEYDTAEYEDYEPTE
jgi:signal transduction histidine kinase